MGFKIVAGISGKVPYGDLGPVEAVVFPHPYLLCWTCNEWLYEGVTATGAHIYTCTYCQTIVDSRRVE